MNNLDRDQILVSPLSLLSKNDFFFLVSLVTALITISRFNYLLFHSLVEVAIFTTGFLCFAFTWHLRRFELGTLLTLGILLGCTAFMSVFHMLAYKGMGVLGHEANLATQIWIACRYMFSLILLVTLAFPKIKINPLIQLGTLSLITLGVLLFVFSGVFPECFDPVRGQTEFKITSEYVISFFLILSMGFFWKNNSYPPHISWLVMLFFGFSILTELVFTSYLGVYDLSNMLGHIFHLIASYFLYKAVVERGLVNPFELMFKNLNDAVRARDEFISLASHELKTPLTPLKLHLEIFQRELQKNADVSSNNQILRFINSSNQQVDRLNKLIDGMLDVSRLSSNQFKLFLENVELSALIHGIAKRYEFQIQEGNSNLELKFSPAEIEVDPMRIEQVITNLLMNAIKYAPGNVEIGVEKTADNKVKIWVSDNGPGISKELQERIFKRYERGISNTSVGGLGLGLYISRQIIEAHGGTLSIESNVGKGSSFIILL